MMDSQKFCLKWDGFQSSVTSVFDHLRRDGELVDITLCCEGQRVKAHRMMLSACSPYFRDLLRNNPCQQLVFFLKDTSAADLSAIIEFMYKGSVNVAQSQLASFLKTAEMLQIKGLSGDDDKSPPSPRPVQRRTAPSGARSPPSKRHRSGASDTAPTPTAPTTAPTTAGTAAGSPPEGGSSDLSVVSPLTSPEGRTDGVRTDGRHTVDAVKVEKVEFSDEDASLDATIGYVADFEASTARSGSGSHSGSGGGSGPGGGSGGGGGGVTGFGDTMDHLGSLAALQDGRLARDTAAAAAAVMALAAGPSAQRLQPYNCLNSQGKKKYSCDICGKVYNYRDSVYRHKRTHEGKTGCFVCGKVLSCLPTLREHLRFQHGMSQSEVAGVVAAGSAAASPMALQPVTSSVSALTSSGGGVGAAAGRLGGGTAPLPPLPSSMLLSAMSNASSNATAAVTGAGSEGQPIPRSLPPTRSAE